VCLRLASGVSILLSLTSDRHHGIIKNAIMAKRAAPQDEGILIKRARSSEPESNNQQLAISSSNDERQKALVRSVKRTSNLEAPIVSLSGAHSVSFLH